MQTYQGKSVYGGIAIGRIRVLKKETGTVKRVRVSDTDMEYSRFLKAKEEAKDQLDNIYQKAIVEVGKDNAAIFEIHRMMLDDRDYNQSVENIIKGQELNAEYAVATTGENFAGMFSSMEDSYMQGRAADVRDISERLIRILSGKNEDFADQSQPVILVADDLTPSETVQLDKSKLLAFVTRYGSMSSHTAILARTMNIPALIRTELPEYEMIDKKEAIVDGFSGVLYVEPQAGVKREMEERQDRERKKAELLKTLKGKDNVTLDGKRIKLYANIGNIRDLALVKENDAGGIGLFRSEFIYLERDTFPDEETQFGIYKTAVETMAGKKVIIRTLDIGADKQADYFNLPGEENPAMGLRAIRLCLARPEIFKTQLRALFRAAIYGNLSIMYPMITSLAEVKEIKRIVTEVGWELSEEGIPFQIPEQGIMIETPSAVMLSDILAREVSFFSIGTNDLTQYTLAMDRQNSDLDEFWDSNCQAVMRMIEMTIKNAHRAGIWVGVCGELGGDPKAVEKLLKMGIDELSVSPGRVLGTRKIIREAYAYV